MAKTKEYTSLKDTHKAHGRKVTVVHDTGHGWKPFKSKTVVPDSMKLLNFDLVFGEKKKKFKDGHSVDRRRTILCLDNYGNEIMCSKVFKNLFNGCDIFDFLLGIDRESGEILSVSFLETEEGDLVAAYCPLVMGMNNGLFVPPEYRKRLDELKSRKRPWFVTLPDTALFSFIERYYGYCNLEEAILVDLEFDDYRVQVGQDMWREVSNWK